MVAVHVQIVFDTRSLEAILAELTDLVDRRGSLPEFRDLFVELADSLDGSFEALGLDHDRFPAGAGNLLLNFQPGERFLGCLAALRAFDLDFGIERGHGGLLPC